VIAAKVSAVPAGTVLHLLLTRQFPSAGSGQALPGYFHSPLPGLDRGCLTRRLRLCSEQDL